ncbi:MAG TPA: SDR family NAD(P)-dependent oxidoreductase [Candidatus Limnocylindria bacterium]|nr:SDR family NAD(P)-dependent oxidoreductase [Candidatus Limnocylindria bacterium]
MKLEGQVALITGASHGLGLAIAHTLAASGASIGCVARASPALDQAIARLRAGGAQAIAAPADVTRESEIEAAVRATVEQWGRLDIVILNAGTWKPGKVHETTEADWDLLIDLNLKGAFLTLKHAVPWLAEQRRGTIVGIDSLGGLVGLPDSAAYAASKWGLRGLLESVALEVKPRGVRVSIVYPHNINSEKRKIAPDSEARDRNLEPEEVASLVAFVCEAPDHVAIGSATILPLAAGIRTFTGES